jgi:hypothetical protein
MTKRLQVLLGDRELGEIKRAAKRRHQSVAEWVRNALRHAREAEAGRPPAEKLRALYASVGHDFPTGSIEQMLDEIEQGYRGAP